MLKSGAEPPGATIWYSWRVTDKSGQQTVSEPRRVLWLGSTQQWSSISSGGLTLHSYAATAGFAQDLLDSALGSLKTLQRTTGLAPRAPIDMYVYANSREMQDALLSVPAWTGGMAYPEYNSLVIGISPDRAEWGKQTLAHELTHIVVGHFIFSCVVNLPSWLNEGMAVYGQGGPDDDSLRELRTGIASNR